MLCVLGSYVCERMCCGRCVMYIMRWLGVMLLLNMLRHFGTERVDWGDRSPWGPSVVAGDSCCHLLSLGVSLAKFSVLCQYTEI